MVTEPGTKVIIQLSDETVIKGTLLAHSEEFGQDMLLIDTGDKSPLKINSGFLVSLREEPGGEVHYVKSKALRLVRGAP